MIIEEPLLTEQEIESLYGHIVVQFPFTFEEGDKKKTEGLSVRRRVFQSVPLPRGGYQEICEVSLLDSMGRRLIRNTSAWNFENDRLVDIWSRELHSNYAILERNQVARHNLSYRLPDAYRIVPRTGAALVAYTAYATDCPVWHSSDDLSPGKRGSIDMYGRRLNRDFGHLVRSVPNGYGGFDVYRVGVRRRRKEVRR